MWIFIAKHNVLKFYLCGVNRSQWIRFLLDRGVVSLYSELSDSKCY
jgi:hypothetical protein